MAEPSNKRTRLSTPAAAQGLRDIHRAIMAGREGTGPGHLIPRYQPYQPYQPQDPYSTHTTADTVQIKEEYQSDVEILGNTPTIANNNPTWPVNQNEQKSHRSAHQIYSSTKSQSQPPTHGSPAQLSVTNSAPSPNYYTPTQGREQSGQQELSLPLRSSRIRIDPNLIPPYPSPMNYRQRKNFRRRHFRKLHRQYTIEQQLEVLGTKAVKPAAAAASQSQNPTRTNTDSSIPTTPTTNPIIFATPSPTPASNPQASSTPNHNTTQSDSDSDSDTNQNSTPSTPTKPTIKPSTMTNSREKILKLMLKEQRREIKLLRTILLEKKVNWLMVEEIKKRMASDGLDKQDATKVVLKAHGHTLRKELVSDGSDDE